MGPYVVSLWQAGQYLFSQLSQASALVKEALKGMCYHLLALGNLRV